MFHNRDGVYVKSHRYSKADSKEPPLTRPLIPPSDTIHRIIEPSCHPRPKLLNVFLGILQERQEGLFDRGIIEFLDCGPEFSHILVALFLRDNVKQGCYKELG